MEEEGLRYILLDRDGVVNRRNSNGSANCWDKFEFLPRALEALRLLAANRYAGILISRQTCACDGVQSSKDLDTLTRRFLLEVALSEGHIARVYYCRHRKEDGCNCFEPSVGLIARAKADYGFLLEETYFIGDKEFDLQAAAAAGCPCIRIQRDAFLQIRAPEEGPYKVVSNLYEAAEQILALRDVRELEFATLQL
jgi:D-glycero-D-manno-heptose 1,7-bisphosphate phosphatase